MRNLLASFLLVLSIGAAGAQPLAGGYGPGPAPSSGSGSVSLTAGNGILVNPSPITGTGTISNTLTTNAQTGTSYAFQTTDGGKLVSGANSSAKTYTLPVATTTGFTTGFGTDGYDIGAGGLTITATTSIFDNGSNSIVLTTGQDASIYSDGANYHAALSLPLVASNGLLANTGGSANYPVSTTLTALMDAALGSTRGSVLYRGASGWTALPPGTSGNFLQTAGVGADPSWQAASGSGTVTTLTAGTNITFSSGATCTTTCTINAAGSGGTTYTATFSGAVSGTPGATGLGLVLATATFTDNNTAASGTAALFAAHSIAAPTLAATNTSVTTTEADTLYIAAPPTTGANETVTAKSALAIGAGDINFLSNTSIFGMYNAGGPGQPNFEKLSAGWISNAYTISTTSGGTLAGNNRNITISPKGSLTLNAGVTAINIQFAGSNLATFNSSSLVGNVTNGAQIGLNNGSTTTAPTLIPNRNSTTTGLGGGTSVPAMIVGGATIENWGATGPSILVIPSSSAAATATMCWTTGGALSVDPTATCLVSARKFKKNIRPLDAGLAEVLKMQPVSYELKADPTHVGRLPGFIADDAVTVDRRLVTFDKAGAVHGFRYDMYVAVLTKAIQEQQREIDDLKRRERR